MATVSYSEYCKGISDNPLARVDLFDKVKNIPAEKVAHEKVAIITASVSDRAESLFKVLTHDKV